MQCSKITTTTTKATTTTSMEVGVWHSFLSCSAVGAMVAFAYSSITILWPFYTRDIFQFGSSEYAWFILIGALVCTFCVALLPSLEMHVGPRANTMAATMFPCLGVVAFLPMWGAFQGGGGGGIESLGGGGGGGGGRPSGVVTSVAVAIHVLLVVCCLGSLRLAEASMKSLAPSFVPKKEQGKAFGTMATVRVSCFLLLDFFC